MIYRLAGRMTTSYRSDRAIIRQREDRIALAVLLLAAFVVVPTMASSYWLGSILIPFLVLSLAALGLNIITGYCGQLSLGTAGFMAVGAFTCFNVTVRYPGVPFVVAVLAAAAISAAVGVLFGLCSARIRGFYVAVATLAAQFFFEWLFTHVAWFTNHSSSGVISTPPLNLFGFAIDTPARKYLVVLATVVLVALLAKNLVRSSIGRAWMATRDMEVAAAAMGIRPFAAKLTAFAVSSAICGVAGVLWAFIYLGSVEPEAFNLHRSFQILFMVIIGGLGSIAGAFLGAGFITLIPVFLTNLAALAGGGLQADTLANLELMIFGGLIVLFLILEPKGLARLLQVGRDRLLSWPFSH